MAKNNGPGKDVHQIMDEVCETELSSSSLARIHLTLQDEQYPDLSDIRLLHEDLCRLRYRYTLAHMSSQVAQLVMREKETVQEIIGDMRHAGKTLVWLIGEFKNILKNSKNEDDEK